MPPRTRAAAARQTSDKEVKVTYISSDSESESRAKPAKKRKTEPKRSPIKPSTPAPQSQIASISKMKEDNYAMDIDEWSLPIPATSVLSVPKPKAKNAHLKGRKRFMADLEDMRAESAETSIEMHGLQVKSLRAGDEEGSIELKVLRGGNHFISLNLLIDDTASYPREHTFYSFTQDVAIPPHVLEVVEKVSSASPRSLEETVASLLASISASFAQGKYVSQEDAYTVEEDPQDGESESDDAGAYEDDTDYHFGPVATESQSRQFAVLKGHFISVIEAGFKPGLTRFSDDEMVLSISSPVPSLSIPPRAMVAWDRRLLLSYHNLTLLISGIRGSYPVLSREGSYTIGNSNSKLRFHVGLSPNYKPSKDVVLENVRNFGLSHAEDEHDFAAKLPEAELDYELPTAPQPNQNPGRFEKFSLSSSLESLLDSQFISVLELRLRFKLGWAGAEILHAGSVQSQQKPEDLVGLHEMVIQLADVEEARLQTYSLPADPLLGHGSGELNLPLIAYSYLLRRFTLCSRYCLVCHTRIATSIEALKPYVCSSKLCTYQYYALNFGPSIEYEIRTNHQVVDLLVSLAYASAREHQLSDSLPVGLGMRVPLPKELPPAVHHSYMIPRPATASTNEGTIIPRMDSDGLCDFDELPLTLMRAAITEMIDSLPSIMDMKRHLERRVKGKVRPHLKSMDEKILPAAWSILRWCVASSTAYLEEISDRDEMIPNIDTTWRQFRFSVGAPDKEARYKAGLEQVQKKNPNAQQYPALYGFHGSSLRNWHSIIRQGLLVKQAVHGRAYGDGEGASKFYMIAMSILNSVYFAKDGAVSMGHYAQGGTSRWGNSETKPLTCVALAEIVNSPSEFTSNNPYYVVAQVDWILCRYLLVKTDATYTIVEPGASQDAELASQYVPLDPSQTLTMGAKKILIPEQSHKLQMLLEARRAEEPEHDPFDEEDEGVLNGTLVPASQPGSQARSQEQHTAGQSSVQRAAADDWEHSEEWCDENTYQLLPPPTDSTPYAALALQKELRAMLKEQEKAEKSNGLTELGWYMPPELMGDNLFRWMLELHSFDPDLPIAQDMIRHNVPSLLLEIRFPPSFPIQPPFFRIIKPRFLPFIQGGGGHVTGGGSICMDLLVSDGWLPSYNLAAILLQIKLAISNLDPRPARLASNWDTPYSAAEALEGFKRAARTHGWTVPDGLERLVR